VVASFVGRSVTLLRFESKSVNNGRRMLYPMLANALDSRIVRLREASFAGHTPALSVHVHASLACKQREHLAIVLTQQRLLEGLLMDHI